jgi:hypothetical protein
MPKQVSLCFPCGSTEVGSLAQLGQGVQYFEKTTFLHNFLKQLGRIHTGVPACSHPRDGQSNEACDSTA